MQKTGLLILSLVIAAGFACKKSDDGGKQARTEEQEYYTVTADRLMIREAPDVAAKAIGTADKSEKLLRLERTNKFTQAGGRHGEWFKVQTAAGLVGYAFSGFMVQLVDFKINSKPFDISGVWHMYYDPPNASYYFYPDKRFKAVTIAGYESSPETSEGTYEYDGASSISVTYNSGKTMGFQVVNIGDRTTLKLDAFFFDEKSLRQPIDKR